ncbi:MAG: IS1380 family transposase [Nitrosotalea sp.]
MEFSGYKIEYSDKNVTPFGGLIFMKEMLEKTGIMEQISKEAMPISLSQNRYTAQEIIECFMASVWCGACNFLQTEHIRYDETLKEIFGWRRIPSHVTYGRFFKKFSLQRNNEVFPNLQRWWHEQMSFNNVTVDFDSTVVTRYGEQEGAKKGYNPHKRGRPSHHPLMAFISEVRMIANAWLRSGNTSSASSFAQFLEETLRILEGKIIGLVRADSGFYSQHIFDMLEQKKLPYVIAAKMHKPLQYAIKEIKTWTMLDKGIWIAETTYQAQHWLKPRRIVVVKQYIPLRPKAGGKIIKLFDDEVYYENYRYHAFVTNQDLPAQQIWNQYKGRGDAENRIKELKYDFAIAGFSMKEFYATEAAFRMVLIAYNLLSLFRQCILQSPVQHRLSTIRFNCFTVGAWVTKKGNSKVLKMALKMKKRQWMNGLFANYDSLIMPINFKT